MIEKLEQMQHHTSLLDQACCDLETAAEEMEYHRDMHLHESAFEKASFELVEEIIDVLCALSRSQTAISRALHHHIATHHKLLV